MYQVQGFEDSRLQVTDIKFLKATETELKLYYMG